MGRVEASRCVSNLEMQVSLNSRGERTKIRTGGGRTRGNQRKEAKCSFQSKNEDLRANIMG